jgi:nicotinate-nucleotide adenylyltransferase
MDIGVLGGTFDPIHIGHLFVAEEVVSQLNLTEILFVPVGQPWLRVNSPIATAEQRVQMVSLAIANRPCFKLSTMEVERAGPSYTADTIAELQRRYGADGKLVFILGWDSLVELPRWKDAAQIIKMCNLVAVPRMGYHIPDPDTLESVIPGLSQSVILLDAPRVDICASEIRDRVAQGLSIRHLVPEPVGRYIKEHKLYITS